MTTGGHDSGDLATLTALFEETAAAQDARAPLYAALCRGFIADPELGQLLMHAPATQRLPVLLLACTHDLVLRFPGDAVGKWYPSLVDDPRSPSDPDLLPTFKRFVGAHIEELKAMLATRRTQTNEVGRCAAFLPLLGMLGAEVGPLSLIDVGASGGLNLLIDRYQLRYDTGTETTVVGPSSAVVIHAAARGPVPLPKAMPIIAARCGIDINPIDVADDDEARWLTACVWPDQLERFRLLKAAIGIARSAPPTVLGGNATAKLAAVVSDVGSVGHPVVMSSWVLSYLTAEQRVEHVATLDAIGSTRDLSWIHLESPQLTPELPRTPLGDEAGDRAAPPIDCTTITLVRWRSAKRQVQTLGTMHPHGFWIDWAADQMT